jgi:hypothetical protein
MLVKPTVLLLVMMLLVSCSSRDANARNDCRHLGLEQAKLITDREFSFRRNEPASLPALRHEKFALEEVLLVENEPLRNGVAYNLAFVGDRGTRVNALIYGDCDVQLSLSQ